jgi:endonuclease/exonuclease/phosphatase family metal-dependent hydrolase
MGVFMMKKSILLMLIASLAAWLHAIEDITIATYNIRRAGSEKVSKNLWENRKELVVALINKINPDVIGLQEVVENQFDDLRAELGDQYASFGEPRNKYAQGWLQNSVVKHPSAKDEHSPIFYNKKRLVNVKQGTFGINPTNTYLPRICTWGLFEEVDTGKRFYVYNTHLSNTEKGIKGWFVTSAGKTRREQIKAILADVDSRTEGLPVVLMGDLNTNLRGKHKLRILAEAGFQYAKTLFAKTHPDAAGEHVRPKGKKARKAWLKENATRTGWDHEEPKMIDHIFIKAPKASVESYEVVKSEQNGQDIFPSDHRPVVVNASWK